MERLVKGDVVVLPFPFSNLSSTKKRPALVVATLDGDDVICCQITSAERFDDDTITLLDKDFVNGSLEKISSIRPNKIFTADKSIILYRIGVLQQKKIKAVQDKLIHIFQR